MTIKVGRYGMTSPSNIIISDRARSEMGDLDGLETSIKESELINPLAVMENGDGTYRLLAGGRRLTILSRNNVPEVPIRIYSHDLSEEDIKTIELAENFYRKNFEYWEEDKIIQKIHTLQQAAKGIKLRGPGEDSGWRLKDTANMIGKSKDHVCQAIKRAEARDKFPELFQGCKKQKDATKLISTIAGKIEREEVAKQIEANKSGVIADLSKRYVIRDFFEAVKEIPAGTYNIVEIDPPYGIDLKNARKTEDGKAILETSYNEIPSTRYKAFLTRLFKECYRVMANDSWMICWFGPEPWFEPVFDSLTKANFKVKRIPGIWAKPSGQSKRPYEYLGNAYEMFFYAKKGNPQLNKPGRSNIFNFSPVPATSKIHPTERPLDMIKELLDTFGKSGSNVLVPFLGSGKTLLGAYELGMKANGYELGKSFRDSYLVMINKLYGGR